MSDKRKPIMTILLKKQGKKTQKVELFEAHLFSSSLYNIERGKNRDSCYRLRVNGRWFPKGELKFYWKSDIRNMLFRSIKIK